MPELFAKYPETETRQASPLVRPQPRLGFISPTGRTVPTLGRFAWIGAVTINAKAEHT